ncbi:MAG TPA: ATP-dependent DNA helicase RecG [Syntrophomonadaceae bacterium]|nr:ATP-dependent DNA helicase RecG [Syntrophomonadaceae bacterium]
MDKVFREIQYVKGIGPKRSQTLARLNINTVFDLLWHMPRAYINRENLQGIAEVKTGEQANLKGKILTVEKSRSRNGMHIFKATIEDRTGLIRAVWFNQPYLVRYVKPGQEIYVSGKVKNSYGGLELTVSEYELISTHEDNRKVLPIYALTEGLNQKFMRSIVLNVLNDFLPLYPEIFSDSIREEYGLGDIRSAFKNMHFPDSRKAYAIARRRLALEELFLFQLSLIKKPSISHGYTIHKEKTDLVATINESIPFELTNAQKRVLQELYTDMENPISMNRLIQGDVGSGKTVVAALAMAKCVASGYQSALMAPTEILAKQHFKSLSKFFNQSEVVIACLTGSTGAAEKRMIVEAVAAGNIDILVGTHSLIQEGIHFRNLGLAVIDEQHRFGVKQRATLVNKGFYPDLIVMTATPIPRTLALTVYGDLDLSVIDELPPGRKPIKTYYIKSSHRNRVYDFVQKELEKEAQVYIVCPLVEESEKQDLQAAVTLYEELKNGVFKVFNVGLIHGRLKAEEKDYTMNRLQRGEIDVLVSTTVIEVGVDVPNASIIVIEQAERFGLSQLHQLRGRVGRGNIESHCFLIAEPKTEEAIRRLKAMEKTNDGFVLATEDLVIRGPGDFWGVRQHGLDQLKVANLVKDTKLIELSKRIIDIHGPFENLQYYVDEKFKTNSEIAPN